jgi:hypothetical protein
MDATNTTEQATTASLPTVGEAVEVHSFGRWYPGEVVSVGRTRVVVRYTTGTGKTRDKAFSAGLVRRLLCNEPNCMKKCHREGGR